MGVESARAKIDHKLDPTTNLLRLHLIELPNIEFKNPNAKSQVAESLQTIVSSELPERHGRITGLLDDLPELLGSRPLIDVGEAELSRFIRMHLETKQEALVRALDENKLKLGIKKSDANYLGEILLANDPIRSRNEKRTLRIMEKLQNGVLESEPGFLDQFAQIAETIAPKLKRQARKELEESLYEAVVGVGKENHIQAAEVWGNWLAGSRQFNSCGVIEPGEEVDLRRDLRGETRYLETFLPLVTPKEVDAFGLFLQRAVDPKEMGKPLEVLLEKHGDILQPIIQEMPFEVMKGLEQTFREAGLITGSATEKIKLSPNADEESLTFAYLREVQRAQKRLSRRAEMIETISGGTVNSMEDIQRTYASYTETRYMNEIPILTDSESQQRLVLAGIGIGNQNTAVDFMIQVVKIVRDLPADQKPNVIVVNELLSGAFENRLKNMQATLVPGLETLEGQMKAGRVILDELQTLGVPVVLNLGNPDWEIGRDIVLRMLRHQLKLVGHIPYYEQDQLQQMKEWSIYDRFVVDVALPYCLRKGEMLPSSDLLVLFDIYQELNNSKREGRKPVISREYRKIIDVDKVSVDGKIEFGDNLYITDNCGLTIGNDVESHKAVLYADYHFSSSPRPPAYGDPIVSLQHKVRQLLAEGKVSKGDTWTLLGERELIATSIDGETWIESAPTLQKNEYFSSKGTRNRSADFPRRMDTTRRRTTPESAFMVETRNGHRIYRLIDGPLVDLKNKGDRTTVILDNDDQTGSDTNLSHYVAIAGDVEVEALKEGKVVHIDGGDHEQGKNFKGKEHIETGMPLVNIDDQSRFYRLVKFLSLSRAGHAEAANLLKTKILTGNHEEDSGFRLFGVTHTEPLLMDWQKWFSDRGIEATPERVSLVEKIITGQGDFYRSSTAIEDIGDTGVRWLFQHKPLDKGGAKGSGEEPVYSSLTAMEGFSSDAADILGWSGFHFHKPSILYSMSKVFTIAPAKAGRSKYEHDRAYESIPGMMMMRFGGGLLPEFEFLGRKALNSHVIQDGILSEESLNDMGFFTDSQFDPGVHGFIPVVDPYNLDSLLSKKVPQYYPRSALMKYLWHLVETMPRQVHSTLG